MDLLIFFIVGFTVLKSLSRGLVRELFEVVGLVAAILLAYEYYRSAGAYLVISTGMPPGVANGLAFVLIVLGCAVAAGFLGFILAKALKFTPIGLIDRLGGMGVGLLKGFLFTCMLVVLMASLPFSFAYTSLEESYIARRVIAVLPQVYAELETVLPSDFPRWEVPRIKRAQEKI